MMYPRSLQQILVAIDRLRTINEEAREIAGAVSERGCYLASSFLLWPLSKALKDRYWAWYFRTTPAPILLPRKRERRLSLVGNETIGISPLLALPREIRDIIWEYTFPGTQVHWCIADRRLKGIVCRSEEKDCQSQCVCWIQKSEDAWPVLGVMGLLLSCRQIYSETISLLYSVNTFNTTETDVMAFLPRLLIPDRVNAMRNLQFLWTVSVPPSHPFLFQSLAPDEMKKAKKREQYYSKTWNTIWENMSDMEGLVTLRVELNILGRMEHLWEAEEFYLVRWVKRPQKFHLVLPKSVAERIGGKFEASHCVVDSIDWNL